jgi:hypothetical protein
LCQSGWEQAAVLSAACLRKLSSPGCRHRRCPLRLPRRRPQRVLARQLIRSSSCCTVRGQCTQVKQAQTRASLSRNSLSEKQHTHLPSPTWISMGSGPSSRAGWAELLPPSEANWSAVETSGGGEHDGVVRGGGKVARRMGRDALAGPLAPKAPCMPMQLGSSDRRAGRMHVDLAACMQGQ